jgi:hypothetical protein
MHTILKTESILGMDAYERPEVTVIQIPAHYLSVYSTPSSGVSSVDIYQKKRWAGHYFIYFLHSKYSTHVKKLI